MKQIQRVVTLGLTIALSLGAAVGLTQDRAGDHGPIPWKESLGEAKIAAAKEHKLIFVDFWAPWCGPCKQMLKTTYQDKQVVERARQFVPLLVNFDKQPELVKKYHIGQIPTVLFLDSRGGLIKKTDPKYLDAGEMLKVMAEVSRKPRG